MWKRWTCEGRILKMKAREGLSWLDDWTGGVWCERWQCPGPEGLLATCRSGLVTEGTIKGKDLRPGRDTKRPLNSWPFHFMSYIHALLLLIQLQLITQLKSHAGASNLFFKSLSSKITISTSPRMSGEENSYMTWQHRPIIQFLALLYNQPLNWPLISERH